MSDQFDTIVVGSGMGGMAAALYLAKHGQKVAMLEAGLQFGGYMNPFARKKLHFDVGLHYIGECGEGQPFYRLLEQCDLLDKVRFRELNPDGFDRYVFPGYETSLCKGHEKFAARLKADFPRESAGIDTFFETMKVAGDLVKMATKKPSVSGMVGMAKALPQLIRMRNQTFKDMIEPMISDPMLRAVLAAPCGDLGLPPGRISGIYLLLVLNHYLTGGYYPVGGSGAIRDAFIEELKAMGAELRRRAKVEEIIIENGRAVGVRLPDGEELRARHVISNVDVSDTFGKLIPLDKIPGKVQKKMRKVKPSLGSISVFMATEMDVTKHGITDANIWHYESIDIDGMYKTMEEGNLPDAKAFFLTVPTLKDPEGSRAPEGVHTVEIIQLCPLKPFEKWWNSRTRKRGEDYDEFKDKLGREILELVEQRYLPDLGKDLLHFEVSTPLTNYSYALSPEGSIYGPEHSPEMVGPYRFSAHTPIPGLYLAGASVLGAGVVTCAASGKIAAKMVLKDARG